MMVVGGALLARKRFFGNVLSKKGFWMDRRHFFRRKYRNARGVTNLLVVVNTSSGIPAATLKSNNTKTIAHLIR